jgi:N-acyl-D-aspartate/D-glutamate deacylase
MTDAVPDRDDDIDDVVSAVSDVWHRNPQKTFMQVVARGVRDAGTFTSFDASDEQVRDGLRSIGKS